jgi:hypothetical protein
MGHPQKLPRWTKAVLALPEKEAIRKRKKLLASSKKAKKS